MIPKPCTKYIITHPDHPHEKPQTPQHHLPPLNNPRITLRLYHLIILLIRRSIIPSQKTTETEKKNTIRSHLKMDASNSPCFIISTSLQNHTQVILHLFRDIKPKNIFLTSNGNLKLGSFRASKQL